MVFCSCASNYNVRADKQTSPLVTPAIKQDEKTLVFVALSGGGTRAAAMSWKALETLTKVPYTYKDQNGNRVVSTLAEEIDYISGISGGSFAGAAWCLYKDNMEIFRKRFIERNIQGELAKGLFIPPWQGLRLLSPAYDRINMASELYDRTVFDGKTFGDVPPTQFSGSMRPTSPSGSGSPSPTHTLTSCSLISQSTPSGTPVQPLRHSPSCCHQ